jgi:hypothetical protein
MNPEKSENSKEAFQLEVYRYTVDLSLLALPVKGRFLIHAEGSAGDDSSPSKILQVTDDMEEGLAVVAGRRPKILVDGHPFKTFPNHFLVLSIQKLISVVGF